MEGSTWEKRSAVTAPMERPHSPMVLLLPAQEDSVGSGMWHRDTSVRCIAGALPLHSIGSAKRYNLPLFLLQLPPCRTLLPQVCHHRCQVISLVRSKGHIPSLRQARALCKQKSTREGKGGV